MKKIPKIRDYYGSGWVGPGLTRDFLFFILENHSNIALNQYRCFGVCILSALLKVFSYYDLSVLSMSVMGFQKKSLGGVSSIQVFFEIFLIF